MSNTTYVTFVMFSWFWGLTNNVLIIFDQVLTLIFLTICYFCKIKPSSLVHNSRLICFFRLELFSRNMKKQKKLHYWCTEKKLPLLNCALKSKIKSINQYHNLPVFDKIKNIEIRHFLCEYLRPP